LKQLNSFYLFLPEATKQTLQTRKTENIKYHLTERHIYGSARLGMDRTMVEMAPTLIQAYPLEPTIPALEESERYLGRKYYELSNHLGNVLTVITDEKRMIVSGNNYLHYESVVVSVTDYSPFGVSLTGRTFTTTEGYRYGFQNQETDKELWDGAVSYKYRIEDVRLGRFFSVDPLSAKYPWNSNYAFSENRLIDAIELEGLELYLIHGTLMESGKWMLNPDAISELERIGGNTKIDDGYSWGKNAGLFNDRCYSRKTSAEELIKYVVDSRNQLLFEGKITKEEPITLFGYSHGGNIAIQAAEEISKQTGVEVNIITYATPAYNDSSNEDPAAMGGIAKHIHFYSEFDGVDGIAGGSETYNNGMSVNYKIPGTVIPDSGIFDTHIEMGNMDSNKLLGEYFRKTVGAIKERVEMNKTKVEVPCRQVPY
jgi:RHS repeat-associated protein